MTTSFKRGLLSLIVVAIITVYFIRAFNPAQPVHHELNEAGGVLFVSLMLVWFFG